MTKHAMTLGECLAALESELGLPKGFYDRLLKDDDWSFVIKLHALFESATTYVLSRCLGKPELEEALSHIEMSNRRSGKVAFGKALGIFDDADRRFIYQLSEVRNQLVHRISNTSFTFDAYMKSLDPNQQKSFCAAFGYGLKDPIELPQFTTSRDNFVLENPKFSMWLSGSGLLSGLYAEKHIAALNQETEAIRRTLLESMLKNSSNVLSMNARAPE